MLRIAGWIALLVPFTVAFLLVLEIWLRFTTNLPYISRTHCFSMNKQEAPAFLPDCRETLKTPEGDVEFQTNEDGFRDRPREFFRKGAIALLGDSHVEGFWLPVESGIARMLEKKIAPEFPFLNLGIRASGPTQQAIRFQRAIMNNPVRGAIWFLNPSDPVDEIYFRARNPGFELGEKSWSELSPLWDPTPLYWAITRLSLALRDRVYILIYINERWIKQSQQAKYLSGPFLNDPHCLSLELTAKRMRAHKLPLLFVALPHGTLARPRSYMGTSLEDQSFERLLDCARATGNRVVDLREKLNEHPEWFFRNDWHFNVSGVEALTEIAAPEIRAAWPGRARRRK